MSTKVFIPKNGGAVYHFLLTPVNGKCKGVTTQDYGLGYLDIAELHHKDEKVGWAIRPARPDCVEHHHNYLICERKRSGRKQLLAELLNAHTRREYRVDLRYVLQGMQVFTLNDDVCLLISDELNKFTQSLTEN